MHLCMQAFNIVLILVFFPFLLLFLLQTYSASIWPLVFLFFFLYILPPLSLKQLDRTLIRAQWKHEPGSLCGRSWRLWDFKGHLVNEYEGPSYYNFVNDK